MAEELTKSQYRFPLELHGRLVKQAKRLRQSQNEFVVECVESVLAMIQAKTPREITIPDVVIKARALNENDRHPMRIIYLDALDDAPSAKVAEDESKRAKR